jgi:hypothetical protein
MRVGDEGRSAAGRRIKKLKIKRKQHCCIEAHSES